MSNVNDMIAKLNHEMLEKLVNEIKNRDDVSLMEFYVTLKNEKDLIDKKMKIIKEEFANRLHERKVNELLVETDQFGDWISKYQTTTRKNVDYTVMYERLGPHLYNEIVQENTTDFLTIRKAPKKKNSKTKKKPVEKTNIFDVIPPGNLA